MHGVGLTRTRGRSGGGGMQGAATPNGLSGLATAAESVEAVPTEGNRAGGPPTGRGTAPRRSSLRLLDMFLTYRGSTAVVPR